ncbi:MAG: ABC transporter permease subunit [Chloroflexi bacterium]|nr:ABC transporter permease subunit [Chloroflexota bacterium]
MKVPLIAWLTFQEARRRRIVLAALLLGAAFLALYALGFHFIYREMTRHGANSPANPDVKFGLNFILMAGLYVVNFLVIVLAGLTSVDTISGEIASHTIQAVAAKPIRRWEIVAGKWVGFAGMIALYVLMMAGGVMAVPFLIAGYVAPGAAQGLAVMVWEGILMMSLSLVGGTVWSTLANGVFIFGMYGLAFVGGWIERIGSVMQNETAVNLGIASSLVMPSESLWQRAAYVMQPPLLRNVGMSPFSFGSFPSGAMIGYSVLYVATSVVLAVFLFGRRDL